DLLIVLAASRGRSAGETLVLGRLLNRNTEMLKRLEALVNPRNPKEFGGTIFLGERRIASIISGNVQGTPADPRVIDAVLRNGRIYQGEALIVDRNFYASYSPLRDFDDKIVGMLGVGEGIGAEAYQEIRRATVERFSTLIAGGMIFGFIMTFLFSSWLVRPIRALAAGMSRVAEGDLDHKVRIESADELGRLAHAFNRMVRGVKERDNRLREMTEDRLSAVEKQISIGRLAAGVAHEINNPLTYVIGNVGLALEGLEASALELGGMRLGSAAQTVVDSVGTRLRELGQALREAAEGGERVRQIVADLKRFARTDERARRALELPQILDAAAKMTTHVVRHHARLLTEYGPTPPVEAVEGSLVQVFTNLLVNAAQAIGPGDAEHQEIRIRTATDAEGRAVVEIHDSGPGISAEALPQVFEPFFTTKPRGAGIGLGLAICRSIVSSLGGEIVAESRPGEGSTFRVSLPPARLADAGTTRPPAGDAGARRGRILVIDDEATVANAVERMLRRDHDVSIETDGRAAVERFARGERYDAVFCDLMMPEMSGMQVYDAIRKHDAAQAQRMVFMTGGSFAPSAREFLDRVGNLVLAKPFSIEEIRAAARELVG
ncbi:MAG TPA: ATP-binding protein, partial [Myxococcota bacterium]|nr:ATP-binding protein [Myxococcota bacterium]